MARGTDKLDSQITQETGAEADLRVYKKTSPNSLLTLYLGTRDVICRHGSVEPLRGVIYIDPKFTPSNKIYGQLTLTFRYGREDEEVMGLKFCNEAIIALKQIWPVTDEPQDLSTLQLALLDRLGKNAFAFSLDVGSLAPPSVQLVPAKRYNGAPIGTSYDVRIHMGDPNEERPSRRCMVKLGVRVIHKIMSNVRCADELTAALNAPAPHSGGLVQKTLRLRLSPKSLQLDSRLSTTGPSATGTATDGSYSGASWTSRQSTTVAAGDGHRGGGGNDSSGAGDNIVAAEPQLPGGSSSSRNGGGSHSRVDVERSGGGGGDIAEKVGLVDAGDKDIKGPEGSVDKPFLWTDGRVSLRAALNKSAYGHGEHISVTIDVRNDSRKIIRKIRIFAVQHVDVCMFSNGKFKNVVAEINESLLIRPSEHHRKTYSLLPIRGPTKNWIAVEGSQSQNVTSAAIDSTASGSLHQYSYKIASSAPRGPATCTEDRNVFAIYVSYYIKVKLTLSAMGGEVTLKLPFILGHVEQCTPSAMPTIEQPAATAIPRIDEFTDATVTTASDIKPELGEGDTSTDVQTENQICSASLENSNRNVNHQRHFCTLDDIVIESAGTVATTGTSQPAQFESCSALGSDRQSAENSSPPDGREPESVSSICNIVTAQVHSSAI